MKTEREMFEESNNVNPDWSFKFDEELQQYVAVDFEMTNQVDEFNDHWDTFRAGWQAAKAQAVPDGYCIVPKEPTSAMLKASWDNLDAGSGDEFWDAYRAVIRASQEPAND